MEALKIYDCDRGSLLALYRAVRASRIPKVVQLNPASEDDLIVIESSEVNEGDIIASKKTLERGNIALFVATKLIADASKTKRFTFLRFFTVKSFQKFKENYINSMIEEQKIVPYSSYSFGQTKAEVTMVQPHIREVVLTSPSLKKPEVFHCVSNRTYLPYLSQLQTDEVVTIKDDHATRMSIEYHDHLVFYLYSIALLPPQSDVLISYKKVLYKFKQHEIISLSKEESAQDKSALKTILLPVESMKDFAPLPF